ncbi:MAG: hypothetical protein JW947_08350 [Sedimentisphaerales bacterium]|nr:hypothetical protein [Sedimentisphaerales bacterium]
MSMTKEEYFYRETNTHIRNVQRLMNEVSRQINERAALHDLSKFSDEERGLFVEVTPELSKSKYGSEEYKANLRKIRPAVEHHHQNNPHHPEFFRDGIKDMTLVDLIEMLCDWIAASKRNPNGDIVKSIEQNQERFGYSNDVCTILCSTAGMLWSTGKELEPHHKFEEVKSE